VIPLKTGYYPIRILYFERTGDESITLGLFPVDKKPNAVPLTGSMLFYRE
jgi:hypothetical protein